MKVFILSFLAVVIGCPLLRKLAILADMARCKQAIKHLDNEDEFENWLLYEADDDEY